MILAMQTENTTENHLLFQTTEIGGLFMTDTPLGGKKLSWRFVLNSLDPLQAPVKR